MEDSYLLPHNWRVTMCPTELGIRLVHQIGGFIYLNRVESADCMKNFSILSSKIKLYNFNF